MQGADRGASERKMTRYSELRGTPVGEDAVGEENVFPPAADRGAKMLVDRFTLVLNLGRVEDRVENHAHRI